MKSAGRFADKVVLVTGGASGIGKATALMFAGEGAHVVIADVSDAQGQQVLLELKKLSAKSVFVKCNVSSQSEVENLIKSTVAHFGRIDCAYNNAGVAGTIQSVSDLEEAAWDRIIDTNLKGVWLCMKHELVQMQKQGHGVIVNCASIAGLVGFANSSAYCASKHGIVGLTKAAALECAKSNIRINAVCPGVIDTPMVQSVVKDNPAMQAGLAAGEPVGRIGTPSEIADAVLWLCSDGASFVTGQAIAVDGGWTAQ